MQQNRKKTKEQSSTSKGAIEASFILNQMVSGFVYTTEHKI